MARRFDEILVVDVKCSCWKEEPPEGEQSEIIEIGICTLNIETLKRVNREGMLVRPEHSTVGEYCTKLTTLTQEQVEKGLTFKQACARLKRRYHSLERIWASYGDNDRRRFERQCQSRNITYPFSPTHMNVKNLFALMHGMPADMQIHGALELLDIPPEGTPHRGADDAWNVAAILGSVLAVKRSDEGR